MSQTTKKSTRLTRRHFIGSSAAALSFPWIIPASALGADGTTAPSNRLNMALIGNGCMGRGHLNRLVGDKTIQVMAVCDPDKLRRVNGKEVVEAHYATAMQSGSYKGCTAVADFRPLLERKDIDGIVNATPDHWHTPISIFAARAGKDVYCEKPISMTIQQGRQLVDAVRSNQRVFQNGSQYRSMVTFRKAVNFIRNGGLGKIKAVFTIWAKLNVPTMGPSYVTGNPKLESEAVPDGLDWDLWVGPAPFRPYNSAYHRNPIPGVVPWAFCSDFGLGPTTYYHSHSADVIQYAIGMEESGPVEIIHPSSNRYPTLTCRYANGVLLHHVEGWGAVHTLYQALPEGTRLAGNFGGLFIGENGWLNLQYGGDLLEGSPETIFKAMDNEDRKVNGSNDHHANWFSCIRTREKPYSHEEIGHRGASLSHLVTAGYSLGRTLKWDPAAERFENDAEADKLLSIPLRDPWKI